MDKKILIIGGSGLLGSYLTKWFITKGHTHITATYQKSLEQIPPEIREGIQWKHLTLPDKEQIHELVKGQDWVIHAAGFVSYNPRDRQKLLAINTTGTSQIVNACLAYNVEHLIYVGSKSVLGKEKENEILNEDASWLDNEYSTNYGLSKYLGELEVWRGIAEGLNASVILPSVILGTGNWKNSSLQMVKRIASGSKWYPGGKTGFVDVRDIVSFITVLLETSNSGERWLLCGMNKSYEEIYGAFAKQLGIEKEFKEAPKWLAKLILAARSLFTRSTLGTEMLNQSYGSFTYDASKSLRIEGFHYTDPDESIAEIAAYYKDGI